MVKQHYTHKTPELRKVVSLTKTTKISIESIMITQYTDTNAQALQPTM